MWRIMPIFPIYKLLKNFIFLVETLLKDVYLIFDLIIITS